MKYVKMLGVATVAAAALTAFVGAGAASAAVLCATTIHSALVVPRARGSASSTDLDPPAGKRGLRAKPRHMQKARSQGNSRAPVAPRRPGP
jgi:hypothetical protein